MPSSTNKINYFPGLDVLRFLAASAIIIHHIELLKGDLGLGTLWRNRVLINIGPICVTFFFVLSGFLITYFLLKEKDETKSISLKTFYFKRAIRILPLYYVIVIAGLFILPHLPFFDQPIFSEKLVNNFIVKAILFLGSLPQIPFIIYPSEPVPYLVPLWAVGVETIFYLFWPLVIIRSSNLFRFLIGFIFILAFSRLLIESAFNHYDVRLLQIFDTMRFGTMAIGGLSAYSLYYKKDLFLDFIYSLPIQILSVLIFISLFIFTLNTDLIFAHEIYSILFCVIILNVSTNPKSFLRYITSIKVFDYLGKRSYGIYVYHMICIQVAWRILNANYSNTPIQNLYFYVLAILLSYTLAILSYSLFEKPVLNLIKRSKNK